MPSPGFTRHHNDVQMLLKEFCKHTQYIDYNSGRTEKTNETYAAKCCTRSVSQLALVVVNPQFAGGSVGRESGVDNRYVRQTLCIWAQRSELIFELQ